MRQKSPRLRLLWLACAVALGVSGLAIAADPPSSYAPVVVSEAFQAIKARMEGAKRGVMQRQASLLEERYDLANRPAAGSTMSAGKAV